MNFELDETTITKDNLTELYSECYHNTALYLKTFFPNVFSAKWGSKHHEMFEAIDDPAVTHSVIITHRGCGKTSIARHGVVGKQFIYQSEDYKNGIFIGSSFKKAEPSLKAIKRSIEINPMIKSMFGDIKGTDWSGELLSSKNGNSISIFGQGQNIRGFNFNDRRPDIVILDDVEKTIEVKSAEQRLGLMDWFISDVMQCFDKFRQKKKLVIIGNMMHYDGLIANLRDDSRFVTIEIPVCDDNYKTYWYDYMTNDDIQKEIEWHRERNKMDIFYKEFMCRPMGSETQIFKSEQFRYYNANKPKSEIDGEKFIDKSERELQSDTNIANMITVDPAGTVTNKSDYTAIALGGFDRTNERIYVREIIRERMLPDEIVTKTFDLVEKYSVPVLGVETTSLKEFIVYPFQNEKHRRGSNVNIVQLNPRGGKDSMQGKDRIAALQEFYAKGYVYHNHAMVHLNTLEEELLQYPNSKFDDCSDAVAYFLAILDMGLIYFDPPDYGYESPGAIEKEYDELYKEMENDKQYSTEESYE